MIAAPVRRRFRFTLRTLFVVVTIFACWLGYELNWIRRRHELLAKHAALALVVKENPEVWLFNVYVPQPVPGLLWLFGEEPVEALELIFISDIREREPTADEQREIDLARRLFPEANVTWRMAEKR
jgi:hypothetical protein